MYCVALFALAFCGVLPNNILVLIIELMVEVNSVGSGFRHHGGASRAWDWLLAGQKQMLLRRGENLTENGRVDLQLQVGLTVQESHVFRKPRNVIFCGAVWASLHKANFILGLQYAVKIEVNAAAVRGVGERPVELSKETASPST